jgi:hypothetical protein
MYNILPAGLYNPVHPIEGMKFQYGTIQIIRTSSAPQIYVTNVVQCAVHNVRVPCTKHFYTYSTAHHCVHGLDPIQDQRYHKQMFACKSTVPINCKVRCQHAY